MTLFECLDRVDAAKPNTVGKAEKIAWIDALEWELKRALYDTHHGPAPRFNGLTDDSDGHTFLTAPAPYSEMYVYYVCAMIDHANQEIASYNNHMALYNGYASDYARWYNRTHRPKSEVLRFFTPRPGEFRPPFGALKMTGSDPESQGKMARDLPRDGEFCDLRAAYEDEVNGGDDA